MSLPNCIRNEHSDSCPRDNTWGQAWLTSEETNSEILMKQLQIYTALLPFMPPSKIFF